MAFLIKNGRISLKSFVGGACIVFVPWISHLGSSLQYLYTDFWLYLLLLYIILYNGGLVLFSFITTGGIQSEFYKVAVRGCFLGLTFGIGYLISCSHTTLNHFGWYLMGLSFFHFSEYLTTAATNPSSLTLDSYLLDHSREYKMAAVASWLEFFVEWYIAPGLKQYFYLSVCGVLLVLFGESLRKASMITASTNFNHYVQYVKRPGHQLVTKGVYSWCRHPSYVGWFYWSIGTQLILCNPFCLIAYTIVSWRFFRERIYEEEIYLLNFFGEDYLDYQKSVGTGLPFIVGYTGYSAL
uniref:Protein-S-isoprenylcysteine O-methyltransferase n=3 Tax=Magallana gigas TaxID=29159 RepID=A0A8W8K203_MAGGI|nr:protein-S-isoprenylcysteine O-methyltransferase [Crassostrea gigas]